MAQAIWHHSAPCWHRTPFRRWLSFVLKICLSWLKKDRQTAGREESIFPSAASKSADAELHCHRIRIPRCLRYEKALIQPKQYREEALTDECSESTSSPRRSTYTQPALLPVPLKLEPTRDIETYKSVKMPPVKTESFSWPQSQYQLTRNATITRIPWTYQNHYHSPWQTLISHLSLN